MPYNNFNNSAVLMNQLYRQKDNIENMIAQYTQNMGINQQPPVQNIINTSNSNSSNIDVRFLNQGEDVSNILVSKKTLFIDEKNGKINLKETDGTISKYYDIIIPKDEKDEAERAFYEISEGTILNEERAGHLINNMKPFGKKWELSDTEGVRTNNGYEDIRPVDFWIVMNSAYNDYNDIFKEDVGLYARFSKDFIKDEDAVEDKVYYYFSMIPKE